jgi:carbonic anhydrase
MSHSEKNLKVWVIALTVSSALVVGSFWLFPRLKGQDQPNRISALTAKRMASHSDQVLTKKSKAESAELPSSPAADTSIVPSRDAEIPLQEELTDSNNVALDELRNENANIACEAGLNQSPINLERPQATRELRPLLFEYKGVHSMELENRGRRRFLNIVSNKAPFLQILGQSFQLESISAKFPAEHLIEGENFSAELQFLHRDVSGKQSLILAVLVRGGSSSAWPQALMSGIEGSKGFDLSALIPSDQTYFQYSGSLTESPCNEGVTWIVLKKPIFASDEDLLALGNQIGMQPRPLQATNGRSLRLSLR